MSVASKGISATARCESQIYSNANMQVQMYLHLDPTLKYVLVPNAKGLEANTRKESPEWTLMHRNYRLCV